jgi:hypothetical protein
MDIIGISLLLSVILLTFILLLILRFRCYCKQNNTITDYEAL